ncbi:MAG TPA: ABC transporter ATP-binding protein [bacterium]|nr:ABC transporter ATP-binding protein [bacterium]
MAADALLLQHLTKRYGAHRPPAVDNLSLAVPPGTIFAFLGPNGAGKTTTLKLVLGLVRPDAGTATLLGGPITDRVVRGRIGYLPEEPVLHPFLTVVDLLAFYGSLFGYTGTHLAERVDRTIALVGLEDRRFSRMRDLSKGLRQRVLLGQALINDPELVLLDEPQSGLDPVGMQELRRLMVDLKARGKTVFLNSHQLTEVEQVADRLGVIRDGKLVREGAVADLIGPGGRWTVMVAGLSPQAADRVVEAIAIAAGECGGLPATVAMDPAGNAVFTCADEALAQQVVALAQGAGGRLVGFAAAERSLEQVFLELMAGGSA